MAGKRKEIYDWAKEPLTAVSALIGNGRFYPGTCCFVETNNAGVCDRVAPQIMLLEISTVPVAGKTNYTSGSHPGSYSLLHNCSAFLSFRMWPLFGSVCSVRPVRWAILPNCTSNVLRCPPMISERSGAPLRIASKKLRMCRASSACAGLDKLRGWEPEV